MGYESAAAREMSHSAICMGTDFHVQTYSRASAERWKHRSFTLTQAGWTYAGGNLLYIGGSKYRFHQSREIEGKIKTLTIKRMPTGRFFVFFSCDIPETETIRVKTGRTAGFDFGLRRFLVGNNGQEIEASLPYRTALKALRQASRSFWAKQRGSANWHRARLHLARLHSRVANQRKAWHWELACHLCQTYDAIYLEDLELRGMQRLWGCKIAVLDTAPSCASCLMWRNVRVPL